MINDSLPFGKQASRNIQKYPEETQISCKRNNGIIEIIGWQTFIQLINHHNASRITLCHSSLFFVLAEFD
jgi:hypothetical protein